jgi:RNA polymerase sigma-70 factor (ECF subfamily)
MKNFEHMTDEELVLLIKRGDKEQFGSLMARYSPKLFRYGKKFLSNADNIEDMVQEVFIKTYQNIQSFDDSQRFSPWIYRIAHNTFVNALRKNSISPLYFFDLDAFVSHASYEDLSKEEEEEKLQVKEAISRGLSQLSPKYREVLVLHYLEDFGYKEVSDILHVPVGTVGVRLKRAKEKLKEILHYDHEQ